MRTILILMLVGLISTVQAQTPIPLDAVIFPPNVKKVYFDNGNLYFVVQENRMAEFASDPIAFAKANFEIEKYMDLTKDKKYDTYLVSFTSPAGRLDLDFDKHGDLQKNNQYFYNVQLPPDIERTLEKEHNGWIAIKNKYTSKGVGEYTDVAFYRVKLQNGKKTRSIKLVPESKTGVALAQNK